MSSHPENDVVERSEPTALSGLATSTCSALSGIERQHYESLIKHVEANSLRHPWYGPCDGLGSNGSCSECDNLLKQNAPSDPPAPDNA